MTTLLLFIWPLFIAVCVYRDRKGRKPVYLFEFFIRAMALVLYWFLWTKYEEDTLLIFWVSVYAITSFWIFFEMALNLVRGRVLFYYDFTEGDSGIIDGFFKKLYWKYKTHAFHLAAKVLVFVIMVFSITRIYDLH